MDAKLFRLMTGSTPDVAEVWAEAMTLAMVRWGIDSSLRMTMFLAQCAHESGRFTRFEENLRYSAQRLAEVWPNRYATPESRIPDPVDGKVRLVPNYLGNAIKYNARAIANITYANRMGNGPPETNDGYDFRGRGPIQLTGRDNYTRYAAHAKYPILDEPDRLLEPETGSDAAGWYWWQAGCNRFADKADMYGCTVAINGGSNGLNERREQWRIAVAAMPITSA